MTARHTRVLTALDALGDGDHVGWVVERPTQFTEMAALCLQQGADLGDMQFLFAPQHGGWPQQLPVGKGVPVVDPHVAFLHGGHLDPEAMYAAFRRHAALAAEQGYRGLRVVADMDWLLGPRPAGGQIAAFEQGLDAVAVETGATIVCAYRRESFTGRELAGVMCVHPHELGASRSLGFRIWSSGSGRWHLSGQVDLRAAEVFPTALRAAADGRAALWLDCTHLAFIDMAGMRAIAQVAHGTGASVYLEGANETLRRCWKLMDWETGLPNVEFCA